MEISERERLESLVSNYSETVGSTRTFFLAENLEEVWFHPCCSWESKEVSLGRGGVVSMESLTGTSYDPEMVTEEGVMSACAGMVTPGGCLHVFVLRPQPDRRKSGAQARLVKLE